MKEARMWASGLVRHRPVTPMNVPVHQIMFSSDREAVPPPAAEKIRSFAGDLYRLWLLEDARSMIRDIYGVEVLEAFDALRPFAYKADLARYCVVNHFGGIYLDLSVTDFRGFETADYEFVGFRDPNSINTSWKVANHMFYSTSDSPILRASISQCVVNVARRFYGKDPHFPTGPSVLGRAVANYSDEVKVQIGDYWWLKGRRNKYTLPGQGVIARGKVGGRFLGGISGVRGGNNYNVLWRERDIYETDDSGAALSRLVREVRASCADHALGIQEGGVLTRSPRTVVVVPAGPTDTAVDTLESVFRYMDPELVVVIDDTDGRGIEFSNERIVLLPAIAHGSQGQLWVNLAMAFRFAVQTTDFEILLRLDTDALVLGPGIEEAAWAKLSESREVGTLGAYRLGSDGGVRDWTPARRIVQIETGMKGFRNPALRQTLHSLIDHTPEYFAGEHALGGAVIYRGDAVRAMHESLLLDLPVFANSRLGEDHIFGLLTRVAGYRTADFSGPDDPMAVRWKGLPAHPKELLKTRKLITHSIRSWNEMSEGEIRAFFAEARS